MSIADAPVELLEDAGSLIGDRLVDVGSGGEFEHVYAATGRTTRRVPLAGEQEVELAAQAARDAFPVWRSMPRDERRRILLRIAELLRRDADQLGLLTTVDAGVPKVGAVGGSHAAADWFEYYAGWLDKVGGEVRPTWPTNTLAYTLDEPYGVIGAITPFNAPVLANAMVLSPVLAAGNTAVLKPSPLAPFAVIRFGRLLLEAGLPPGVVNIVPGDGRVGEAVVRSPNVDKVFFEGSTKSARYVAAAAAECGPKPVALELGGKSPSIVFDDVDIERSVGDVISTGFAFGGQGCILGTRVMVQDSVYDRWVEKARQSTAGLTIGDPLEPTTFMGPVINEAACDRIMNVISAATESGQGRLVTGGGRLGGEFANGYFVEPTIFADVDNKAPLAREEIFGPVLSVLRFKDEDEALRLANDSAYGLGAYIQTRDVARVHRLANSLQTGGVFVNFRPQMVAGAPGLPFGGVKASGFGRLGGIEGIREFTRTKFVQITLS